MSANRPVASSSSSPSADPRRTQASVQPVSLLASNLLNTHMVSQPATATDASNLASSFLSNHLISTTTAPRQEQENVGFEMGMFFANQQDGSSASPTKSPLDPARSESHLKAKYLTPSPEETQELTSVLLKRVDDGHGECLFEVGGEVELENTLWTAEEVEQSIRILKSIAATALQAEVSLLHVKWSQDKKMAKSGFFVLIRRSFSGRVDQLIEVRVACCGNVDAGKSTMLGVLTGGELDDGRGHARSALFKHKHELETGRTSAVGMEIMGFDARGQQIVRNASGRKYGWEDISQQSAKVISFLDLAGHEKYLKTTVFGMTGCAPDYVMLIIGSNAGVIGMTKEHLGLALALNVPVLVVVTKVDMCPPNVLEATLKQLGKILKSSGCRKIPIFVNTLEDVVMTGQNFVSERVCPIFQISNVTGIGVELLKQFINLLPTYKKYDLDHPVEFIITDTFSVPGVGTVVSGTMQTGILHVGDSLLLGPDALGHFVPCVIKSIHRKRVPVPTTAAGQSASFALKKIKRSSIRRGMVLVSRDAEPKACWEFEAEVLVLYHSSTICERYQAMIHCGNVRQSARIVNIVETTPGGSTGTLNVDSKDKQEEPDAGVIRTGDRAIVRFRFMQSPEYIKPGARLLFREGRTKGVGKVTRVLTDALAGQTK